MSISKFAWFKCFQFDTEVRKRRKEGVQIADQPLDSIQHFGQLCRSCGHRDLVVQKDLFDPLSKLVPENVGYAPFFEDLTFNRRKLTNCRFGQCCCDLTP